MIITRRLLPDRRASERFTITHDGALYLCTLSCFDDGRLAEIFIDAEKQNSQLSVHANDIAVLASLLLQHGVSAAEIRHSISGPIATALSEAEKNSEFCGNLPPKATGGASRRQSREPMEK